MRAKPGDVVYPMLQQLAALAVEADEKGEPLLALGLTLLLRAEQFSYGCKRALASSAAAMLDAVETCGGKSRRQERERRTT